MGWETSLRDVVKAPEVAAHAHLLCKNVYMDDCPGTHVISLTHSISYIIFIVGTIQVLHALDAPKVRGHIQIIAEQ